MEKEFKDRIDNYLKKKRESEKALKEFMEELEELQDYLFTEKEE